MSTQQVLSVTLLLFTAGDPSLNQPHAPVSLLGPPRSLPGPVVLASHEDVLPDASSDDPGLLGNIRQASMHPY